MKTKNIHKKDKPFNIVDWCITRLTGLSASLPDKRTGKNIQYQMADMVKSAFAVFFTQSPSFLAHQQAMKKSRGRSNAETVFQMEKIPCDEHIRQMLDHDLHFLFVCKPDSHLTLYQWVETFAAAGKVETFSIRKWNGKFSELWTYRFLNQIPLRAGDDALLVNWCELHITHQDTGKTLYHNAWVTDLAITENNVAEIVDCGRARWKVENENNNVLKTKGHHLEHNDCTQAGPKCRTLVIGLAYHGTILPLRWRTVKGKKGHLKGQMQQELLAEVWPYFQHHKRVVVLGDAEFSNEPVINWLRQVGWDFVFRFQHRYQLRLTPESEWQTAKTIYQQVGIKPGEVRHWQPAAYTEAHAIPDLTMTVQWDDQEDEPLCLISTLAIHQVPHCVYDMRFWIETLFGQQKSRGFALNRTRMTTPEHIDRLLLAVAIASCLTLGLGTHLVIIKQTKRVDRSDRRDLSLFQLGWRYLFRLLALNRLADIKIRFSWQFQLPPPGFQAA